MKYFIQQMWYSFFYGSQVFSMFDKCLDDMYTAWRTAIYRYGECHTLYIIETFIGLLGH